MNAPSHSRLVEICFSLGVASIIASIAAAIVPGGAGGDPARGEQIRVLIVLWAPALFSLTEWHKRAAESPSALLAPVGGVLSQARTGRKA